MSAFSPIPVFPNLVSMVRCGVRLPFAMFHGACQKAGIQLRRTRRGALGQTAVCEAPAEALRSAGSCDCVQDLLALVAMVVSTKLLKGLGSLRLLWMMTAIARVIALFAGAFGAWSRLRGRWRRGCGDGSRLPSVLSFIKCRIETFEFHAGIVGGELPIHLGLNAVACQAATSRRSTSMQSMRRFRHWRIMTLSSTTFSQLPCLGV